MDIFESTPRDKFYDILFNANRNLVELELDKLISNYIKLCNALDDSENLPQTPEDLYIELSGNILSNNE